MQNAVSYDQLVEKWAPVLNEEPAGTISDAHRKAVTAAVLQNQELALRHEVLLHQTTQTGNPANCHPVLIAILSRPMLHLVANSI